MILSYIEILLLTLINSGGIFLAIVLSANSLKNSTYKWFTLMTICILGWINFAYLGYSETNSELALIFYKVNGIFVSLFLFTEYMFYFENFLQIKRKLVRYIVLCGSTIFALLLLLTDWVITSVHWQGWGNEIIFGAGNDFFSLFILLLNISLIGLLIANYVKFPPNEKRKVSFLIIGTIATIILNILFNIVSPQILGTAKYQHLGDYSAVLFVISSAYAILSRKFMNVKIALTALLIGIIGMLVIIDIFALSHNLLEQGVKFLILILIAVISIFLVRSVLREIKQKEELAIINKALAESKQKLFDLASEQKDIIDVMGHEIRTPLTAIVQEIKIHKKYTLPIENKLLAEAKGKAELEKILPYLIDTVKTVDSASTHAVALVNDMLETARLDKNRFELNYEEFDVIEVVRSNVELMQKTVDVDDNSVKYDISFVKPNFKHLTINADKTRMGQAVYALLSNAIKYRDPQKDNITVKVEIAKTASHVSIKISDNGIGIDKADISKLGRKFMRLNPKTSDNLKRPGGTGLGLYVVQGVMQHHHGVLLIESEGIGKGSVFTLKVPISHSK